MSGWMGWGGVSCVVDVVMRSAILPIFLAQLVVILLYVAVHCKFIFICNFYIEVRNVEGAGLELPWLVQIVCVLYQVA